jgi:hypothetical protein
VKLLCDGGSLSLLLRFERAQQSLVEVLELPLQVVAPCLCFSNHPPLLKKHVACVVSLVHVCFVAHRQHLLLHLVKLPPQIVVGLLSTTDQDPSAPLGFVG